MTSGDLVAGAPRPPPWSCSPGCSPAADAALSTFSRARAEELLAERRPGAKRLTVLLEDRARYLNTALFLRLLCEIAAIVIVTQLVRHGLGGAGFWLAALTSIGIMLVRLVRGDRRRAAHPRPPAPRAGRAGLGHAAGGGDHRARPAAPAADPDR